MRCTHLMPAKKVFNKSGNIQFKFCKSYEADCNLPCGFCTSCKLSHSASWALRCSHQMCDVDAGSFLTLTYQHVPKGGTLDISDVQAFLKRFRRYVEYHYNKKIKILYCGEYGSTKGRPHYHMLVWGFNFPDLVLYKRIQYKFKADNSYYNLYNSSIAEKLWTHGHVVIGDLTFESAAYTARYTLKKTGSQKKPQFLVDQNGHTIVKKPEFMVGSQGIGKDFCLNNIKDIFNNGFIVHNLNGKHLKFPIPRYYKKLCQKFFPHLYVKYTDHIRALFLKATLEQDKPERQAARAIILDQKLQIIERPYDVIHYSDSDYNLVDFSALDPFVWFQKELDIYKKAF